ncbi:MAG: diacylglycerol kinase family protein [Actinomycetota bacterium]
MRVVPVLGNPMTRDARREVDRVVEALDARGVRPEVVSAPTADAAAERARRFVAEGAERIVCIGGDGIARIGVDAVAGTATVLGLVPMGTGNDFARAVGLLEPGGSTAGADPVSARVDRALADPRPIDAIRTTHGWAASVATLGFSGDVTARANALRWPHGPQRYTVATVLQLPRLRTLDLTLTLDGRRVDTEVTLLAIGNTAFFGGGMRVCPDARPDDGRLQVVVIGGVGRATFLGVFPRVFRGGHVEHPAVEVYEAGSVRVEQPSGDDVLWADGDPLGRLPVDLEVVPGAVALAGAGSDPFRSGA